MLLYNFYNNDIEIFYEYKVFDVNFQLVYA